MNVSSQTANHSSMILDTTINIQQTKSGVYIMPTLMNVGSKTVNMQSHLRSSIQTKSGVHPSPTPVNVGSQTVNIISESHPSTVVNQSSKNVNNIGLITGITATVVVVVMIIVLTLIVMGAIICMKTRQNHRKDKVPTVSNEAYGAIPKSMVAHVHMIEDDTYDYPTMNHQVVELINTTQNEAYATTTEVIQSTSHYY